MTLIRTDEIRTSLISAIQANTNIMAELSDANEVREISWKGQEFTYPNIRVEIVSNIPSKEGGKDFCLAEMNASLYVFSEESSSLQADTIAGIIYDEYHDKHGLNYENITFTHLIAEPIPAIAISERIWRSQVNLVSTIRRS